MCPQTCMKTQPLPRKPGRRPLRQVGTRGQEGNFLMCFTLPFSMIELHACRRPPPLQACPEEALPGLGGGHPAVVSRAGALRTFPGVSQGSGARLQEATPKPPPLWPVSPCPGCSDWLAVVALSLPGSDSAGEGLAALAGGGQLNGACGGFVPLAHLLESLSLSPDRLQQEDHPASAADERQARGEGPDHGTSPLGSPRPSSPRPAPAPAPLLPSPINGPFSGR